MPKNITPATQRLIDSLIVIQRHELAALHKLHTRLHNPKMLTKYPSFSSAVTANIKDVAAKADDRATEEKKEEEKSEEVDIRVNQKATEQLKTIQTILKKTNSLVKYFLTLKKYPKIKVGIDNVTRKFDSLEAQFSNLPTMTALGQNKAKYLPVGGSDEQTILIASNNLHQALKDAKDTFISEFRAEQAAIKIQSLFRRKKAVKTVAEMKHQAAAERDNLDVLVGAQLDRALSSAPNLFPHSPVDNFRSSLREDSIVDEGPMSDFTKSSGNTGKVIAAAGVVAGAGLGVTAGLAAAGTISIPAVSSLVTSISAAGGVLALLASNPIGLGIAVGIIGAILVSAVSYAIYRVVTGAKTGCIKDDTIDEQNEVISSSLSNDGVESSLLTNGGV